MGDRGNIVIRFGSKSDKRPAKDLFLYTHWAGSDIAHVVRKALAKRWRWEDDAYLARIIFDVLTDGDHGSETGFGIGAMPCDNEHDFLIVDCDAQEIQRVKHDRAESAWPWGEDAPVVVKRWTFEKFATLPEASKALDF